jgi:putative endonuclease
MRENDMSHGFNVYILLLANRQLYTGFTSDLDRRLPEHENGEVESTAKRQPVELIHYEVYRKESDARRRESFLKTTEGKWLLRQQIRDILIEKQVLEIPA